MVNLGVVRSISPLGRWEGAAGRGQNLNLSSPAFLSKTFPGRPGAAAGPAGGTDGAPGVLMNVF